MSILIKLARVFSRLALGFLMLYAAIGKIVGDSVFLYTLNVITGKNLLLSNTLYVIVPSLEFVIGVNFLLKRNLRETAIFTIMTLCIFSLFQIYLHQHETACGCFPPRGGLLFSVLMNALPQTRNILLGLLALWIWAQDANYVD